MNLLIYGNIASQANALGQALVDQGYTEKHRLFSIDDLRCCYSDNTYAGEYYVWSLILRSAQSERRGIFVVYGCEEQLLALKQVIHQSMADGQSWLIIECTAGLEEVGAQLTDCTPVPFPASSSMSVMDKFFLAEEIQQRTKQIMNGNFWEVETLKIDPQQADLDTIVADLLGRSAAQYLAQELMVGGKAA